VSQQINLFNPIFLQQKKIFAARTMAQALGLMTVGALVIAGTAWHSVRQLRQQAAAVTVQVAKAEARLASASTEFAPRAASATLTAQAADAETQLAALRRVARIVQSGDLGNAKGYAEPFRALGRQHRDGLWLTGITFDVGSAMSLQGRALDATLVPAYIGRLTQEAVLQGKAFGHLQIGQPAALTAPAPAPAAADAPAAPARFVEFSLQANAAEAKP
jgi:hypothetical protein